MAQIFPSHVTLDTLWIQLNPDQVPQPFACLQDNGVTQLQDAI